MTESKKGCLGTKVDSETLVKELGDPATWEEHTRKVMDQYYGSSKNDFRTELEKLINRYSKENGSNTPDFILAEYLILSLEAFDRAVVARSKWYDPNNTAVVVV